MNSVDENLNQLRDGLALLVCDVRRRAVGVNEDGTPRTYGPSVFADLDDDLQNAMEWCVLERVPFTQDPAEDHDHVLLVLTPDWRSSPHCTKQLLTAKRKKTPIYGLYLRTGRVSRSS